HVRANALGVAYAAETGFILESDPDTVRAPDAAFVRRERLKEAVDAAGFFPGAPDLAVEVVSPGDGNAEVEAKVAGWLEAGTRMVIVVNPVQRTVQVYRGLNEVVLLKETDELDGGSVVPGWTVPVGDLFL
ncbi:MAG: Uma2 family endonuclease, partial [Gemmatimonadota bacterium]